MPRYANPYGVQTPYGRGLNNLSAALFASRRGDDRTAAIDAQAGMYDAHSALYNEQARKASVERELAQRLLSFSTPEAMDETVATSFAVPAARVRAVRSIPSGPSPTGMPPAVDPMARQIGERLFALRTGLSDKTVSPEQIAKADQVFAAGRDREGVMSGDLDPLRVGQAHFATSGKAPFDDLGGGAGTFSPITGDQELNDLGQAKVGTEQAHAGAYRAQGSANDALARQRDLETRTGIRIGAPVLVNDPEVGPMYTSPQSAPGRVPAARPVDHATRLKPVVGEDGTTIWMPDEEAAYQPVGAPPRSPTTRAPRRVSGTDRNLLDRALDSLLGDAGFGAVDSETRNAILMRAEQEWQKGAAGHVNAVKAALDSVAPQGLETPWQWRSFVPGTTSQARPVGGAPRAPAAPAAAAAPGGGLPPQARARLREGTVTTFGNGQSWTLQNGTPVQVQ